LKNDFHSKADGWENYDISAGNFGEKFGGFFGFFVIEVFFGGTV
jgi:hypothetical protein